MISGTYDTRAAKAFVQAATSAPVEAHIVDRSGMIATARVLPVEVFAAIKTLRAKRDSTRNADQRALDATQAEVAQWMAESLGSPMSEADIEDEDDDLPGWGPCP